MRVLVVIALALVALTVGSVAGAGPSAKTSLTITYWEDGSRLGDKTVSRLSCDPPRGTVPRPAIACRRLATVGRKLFAPVPGGSLCTEIYGGAQFALVTGNVDGRRVWAKFQRRNGCEIARWQRVSPWLLPAGGITG
jgi:hypothetical protein